MSKTIDERIVELRMDNSNFERNAATSIGTLAKLKQSLNLTGASKGLEQVNAAAGKVDMRGLGSAVDTVTARFSALQVMGVTALANITNSAVNAGKKMVSALTIDPITTGFKEYETQINAVQTILANTESKGTTIDDVNGALKQLNEYADKTIYNFTEMTRNIGTFTAAGVDLDTSVNAIQGIANLAAVSGSNSQQASTAMYQLSQALAAGTVKLMDWNSVVNAGMGGEVFQNALKETARVHGIAIDDMIASQGSFRETLSEGWLTSEILTETLQKFTLTTEGLTEEQIEANREMLRAKGYTEAQIEEIFKLGNTATDAATKVKTFTQLWDVLKEAAQSGWAQTWQLIVGDFEQAKEFLSPLADSLTSIINKTSEWRNKILELALGSRFAGLSEKINSIINPVETVISKMENLDEIANKVIRGDYKNTDTGRRENLMAEGYNWAVVQNRVNEILGCTVRHSEEAAQAELELYQVEHGLVEKGKELSDTQNEVNDARVTTVKQLLAMSDAELETIGLTKEEIDALKQLESLCEQTGVSLEDALGDPELLSGRTLLINGFKNAANGLVGVFKAMKNAWQDFFPPKSVEERAASLYNLIAAFHKFTLKLRLTDEETGELTETGDKIYRTFRGIVAIVSIVTDVVGGGLKLAFKAVKAILGYFDLDILDVTAAIGDALVKFREMTDVTKLFSKAIEFIAPILSKAATAAKEWGSAFMDLPWVQKAITKIKEAFTSLKELDFKSIGKYIIDGLQNGLGDGAKNVIEKIISIAKDLLTKFCEILGIHSPSREFFAIGQNIIQGLVNGIQNGISLVVETIKSIATTCIDFFKGIDWGAMFAIGISAGMIFFIKKIADAFETLSGPIDAITDILENCADVVENVKLVVKNFAKLEKAVAFNVRMDGVQKLAIAVAILAGSVAVLTLVDQTKLANAVIAIGILSLILIGLVAAMEKLSKASTKIDWKNGISMEGLKTGLLAIAGSLLLVAASVKLIGSMDPEEATRGFIGLTWMVLAIGSLFAAYGAVAKFLDTKDIDKAGGMLLKISASMLILTLVAKMIAGMSWGDMGKAALGIAGLVMVIGTLTTLTMIPGNNFDKLGSTLLKISGAFAILVIVSKTIASMTWEDMGKAAVGLAGLIWVIGILTTLTMIPGQNTEKLGSTLMGIAGAMAILTITAKMLAGMSWEGMGKAAVGLIGLTAVVGALVGIVQLCGKDAPKIAGTLLALSVSIGILAGVAVVLSLISIEGLAKGIIAVGMLSSFMALMIYSTRGASDCKSNLIVMAVAIGVMVASIAVLSLIDIDKLASATIALSSVMGMFALMVKSTSTIQKAMGTLILMTVVVGVIAGILYLMSSLPAESTLAAAISLSAVMLAMSGSMVILSGIGKFKKDAFLGVLALLAMAVPMVAFVGILALMENIQNALSNATILIALVTAMTLLLIPLTIIGAFGMTGAPYLGVLALLAMAVPMVAFVGVLALMNSISNAQANAELLTNLMTIMTDLLLKVAIVAPLALAGVYALSSLSAFMVGMGVLAVGIGLLMDKFPQIEKFLDTGIPILVKLAGAIGAMVGSLVGGFAAGMSTALPFIATQLSLFMDLIRPFIEGAKLIDVEVLKGIGYLSGAIVLLTAANLIQGITSFISGGFVQLGFELSAFGYAVQPFLTIIKSVDPSAIEAAKSLAEMVLVLTAANLIDGIASFITGGTSFADFGAQLVPFGMALALFSATVKGRIDETAVTAAANAGKMVADMAKSLPNSGGVLGFFAGENDMDVFGSQLIAFGHAITLFSDTVKGRIDESAVTAAASAGKIMAEMADTLPNTGGVLGYFAGENDMDVFGAQLIAFGNSIAAFSAIVKGRIDETAITSAASAGAMMVEMANTLPNTGGVVSFFAGDNDMATFGTQLVSFGTAMKQYAAEVAGLDTNSVSASVTAASELAKIQNSLGKTGGLVSLFAGDSGLDEFGTNLKKFGKAMAAYSESVKGVNANALSASTTSFESLLKMAKSAEKVDFDGIDSFGESLKKLGKSGVTKFVEAFTNGEENVKKAGKNLVGKAIEGVESKESAFDKAAKTLAKSGADAISDKKSSFKSAGKDLGNGLIEGIESKETAVYKAAYALGQKAVQGEKDGQKSNSPSKLTILAGEWLGEGLVIGIGNMSKAVYNAGHNLGDDATNSISSTISRIGDAISSDMDAQPTIRPVLDLSGVSSGVNTLNGMLDMNRTIGLMSNINSISALTNSRQNGNEEVVSALDKLNRTMSKLRSGDTYNVNGITYSNGNEISDAVNVLVRATMMEGRV